MIFERDGKTYAYLDKDVREVECPSEMCSHMGEGSYCSGTGKRFVRPCEACEGTTYAPGCTATDRERGDCWRCLVCVDSEDGLVDVGEPDVEILEGALSRYYVIRADAAGHDAALGSGPTKTAALDAARRQGSD